MNAVSTVLFASIATALAATPALTSEGNVSVEDVWRWTWPPYIVVPLLIAAALYLAGLIRMRREKGRVGLSLNAIACFVFGWLFLVLALDSPMHEWSEQLFWVHMTQHELLVLVSAPLLVFGRPGVVWLWSFPQSWRTTISHALTKKLIRIAWACISAPFAAWGLHALALWVWHAPSLFDATLHSEWVHAAQHISFMGTAMLFWWALIQKHSGRLGYGGAVLYVFTTAVHTSVLGALLTFAPRAWYPSYAETASHWHLTALEDQQIGGLIMWIPAGTLLLCFTLVFLSRWMKDSDKRWEFTRTADVIRNSAKGSLSAKLLIAALIPASALVLAGCSHSRAHQRELKAAALLTNGGDAEAGPQAIRKYGCYACHTIRGVPGGIGLVGPTLNGIRHRSYIAGELPNTPENMMHWIQHPHAVEPQTVMPEMNVTEEDSRNIAAYLYTLR
jgi:cytochrome c oxidase assembly factor CtaG/cytochrome c2